MTKCNKRCMWLRHLHAWSAALALTLLAGCGGGGGAADTSTSGTNSEGTTGGTTPNTALAQTLAVRDFEGGSIRALLVNGSNSARTALPESAFVGRGSDQWSVRADGKEAVRQDARGNIAVLNTSTGAVSSSFALSSLAGTSLPDTYIEPRLSNDGRYLMAYWKADSNASDPVLVVWDRQGNIVAEGSPFSYNQFLQSSAIGWTPQGKALYLAGLDIVSLDLATKLHTRIGRLVLPVGVEADNAGPLTVSPDGTRLAVALPTRWQSDDGRFSRLSRMIYVMNLNGSNMRQLTAPAASIRNGNTLFDIVSPVWSPSGTQLVATPRSGAPGCPRIKLLQADTTAPVPVDDIQDSDDGYLRLPISSSNSTGTVAGSCGVLGWWQQ